MRSGQNTPLYLFLIGETRKWSEGIEMLIAQYMYAGRKIILGFLSRHIIQYFYTPHSSIITSDFICWDP